MPNTLTINPEILQNLPPETSAGLVTLITILQTVGVVFIIYFLFQIINIIINIKRNKRIKRIERKLNQVDNNINKLLNKKQHTPKEKKKKN